MSTELALQLPLAGVQLIEASAGTGKTHTLARLYARLVLEARLVPAQILAVTYTRAAAEGLHAPDLYINAVMGAQPVPRAAGGAP